MEKRKRCSPEFMSNVLRQNMMRSCSNAHVGCSCCQIALKARAVKKREKENIKIEAVYIKSSVALHLVNVQDKT